MGTTRNTAYSVKVDRLQDEAGLNIEEGALHVHNGKLKVHLNGAIEEVSTGAAVAGGGVKTWVYSNTNYTTSANALDVKALSNPFHVMRNATLELKTEDAGIITPDFSGNEDAIIPTAGSIYKISVNMNMDVEVNDNTVEFSLRDGVGGTIIQSNNIDSNKNTNTGYSMVFSPFVATAAMVSNGIYLYFDNVTSGGATVKLYNIKVTIEELGTNNTN